MRMREGCAALTEKEKQTLRLMVRGHDAKSIARDLGLSVHTINERLRDARRKMAVSSSREAARLLLEAEGGEKGSPAPDSLGDTEIGGDGAVRRADQDSAPTVGAGRPHRPTRIIIGAALMTLTLGLLAFAALTDVTAPPAPAVARSIVETPVVDTARRWLALVDQGRWDESYRETGSSFRKLNSAQTWARVSEEVRPPLGTVTSRILISQQDLPAPPAGYQVVKFRTQFSNKADAVETVTLEREAQQWRVVGVTIE
ncbi:DNA-binding CsgD family transcriptional regulator [Sphingobium sp. OAS761]|nr:DNA-binding CsgD family transcriptional regulator [Sphingobium sp. OAS761]